ncbi:putative short-chain dehydrogenase/reductase family 42E member 2 [Sinocyclocheilus anshuiensis]|uniref:putative short-chain dehydrogenase/reductase family 42E member 2 n=1 Tax=Sinocyclocheilus anshuiensis TaxID=1608454 RepID=UPI0007B9E494|nr:PREDICTED: putative short-chain dehydrogenase/reductase family 42E member 2 [Sinocyclocheilus anshuiensis]XP_016324242.1 PREDICTED: putative short-chain dehydrogenase/reductase family 42E member 2 [Sinocyclocheilus anshuiensis]
MKENRSLCQVEQLPCACLLDCHRQTHTRSAAGAPIRHRANGAVGALCNSPNCVVAARLENSEQGRHGAGRVLVTGGAGYFGFRLGRALAGQGATVLLLDLHKPPWDIPDGAVFQQIDIRDYDALYRICAGVDVIYHTASYGMSGPEQLKKKQIESVNVCGTDNVINVCTERGISRLIYTSTVNVAFAGRPIEDGDEDSVPCVPLDMHIDHYSRTKAIAERMVLAANGRSIKGGGLLHSCVLRPSGIYGPEERRHLHRVMVNVERRLFSFHFGDPNAKMNWVHVDNLVMAHVLAAEALTADKAFVASGQVYFINDGESVNVFEWLTPLFQRLGYGRPLIHLPVSLVYSAAILMERLHVALSPIMEIPLLLTRNEVRNIAVSHTFKIEKAQRELGFSPKKYSLTDSVDQYLRSRAPRSAASFPNTQYLFLLLLMGFIALMICSAGRE